MRSLTLIFATPIVCFSLFEAMFSASESRPLLPHEHWMREALRAAREARAAGEVPVGTCVVSGDELLAVAGNRTRTDCDPTAHAEIVALRQAAPKTGNYT